MADTIIDIPTVGQVAFPDSMSEADIEAAAAKLYKEHNPDNTAVPEPSLIGRLAGPATIGASYVPQAVSAIQTVATPQNIGKVSTFAGLAKAAQDLYEGHPIDALEHAALGAAPSGVMRLIHKFAPDMMPKTPAANVIEYAKQAGERLVPSNVVPAPTIGGAVDKYAESMGQRVVRLLGPNGEVLPSVTKETPSIFNRTGTAVAKWVPFLRALGLGMSSASEEAEVLSQINSPESIGELASRLNDAGRGRLLNLYRDQQDYLNAIKAAMQGAAR